MNEGLLNTLTHQAEEYADGFEYSPGEYPNDWSNYYDKKLVELVLQECFKALWSEDCHVSDLASLDHQANVNKIKRHFGISP